MNQLTDPVLCDEVALRALLADLGQQATVHRFDVAPNPCVGAALLAGSDELGRGFHAAWGGPHAEIAALEAARARSDRRPDTLVVTLEPCSSTGKTPPCVEAILASGVSRIVVSELDPDPRHRGRGLRRLVDAGLEVVHLPYAAPLEDVAPHFARWVEPDRLRRPRPWTIAKWAQTRSGHLSPPEDVGEGRWISSPPALADVHRLREHVDAIVTGIGTVLADDPRLTVRVPGGSSARPWRIVLDSYLRTPADARLFEPPGPDESGGRVVLHALAGADGGRHRALSAAGAEIVGQHTNEEDHVRLWDVQTWLWENGIRRVLLESGPTLLSRFLELGFVDQVRIYTGNVNGGRGTPMGEWIGRLRLDQRDDREVGDDSRLDAFVLPS